MFVAGSTSAAMLNKTATPQTIHDDFDSNNTRRPPQFPLHRPPNTHDRFRPERPPQPKPAGGGTQPTPPTLVHVDKISPHQLQELLHHLTTLGEGGGRPPPTDQIHGGGDIPPPNGGTYVQVQSPQQVRELERELGAKFVDRAEDGSYIVMIPNDDQIYPDQVGSPGQGGPPFSHSAPPGSFPGQGSYLLGLACMQFQLQKS